MRDGGEYWWYGEHKVYGKAGNAAWVGVHAYSSKNLVDWEDRGIALAVSQDPESEIVAGCIIERPKVVRNAKTGNYVMFFHLELKGKGYSAAKTGIALANRPEGPFVLVRTLRPNGAMSRDMTGLMMEPPLRKLAPRWSQTGLTVKPASVLAAPPWSLTL